MERVEIKFDEKKKGILIFSVILLGFVFCFATFFLLYSLIKGEIAGLIFLPIVLMLFFVLVFNIFTLRKIIKKLPAYILDENGITDLSKMKYFTFGFIPWSEITSVEGVGTPENWNICIELKNPDGFIKQKPFIIRNILKKNRIYRGSPILINTLFLEGHFKPVTEKIKTFWGKYR